MCVWFVYRSCLCVFLVHIAPPCDHASSPKTPDGVWSITFTFLSLEARETFQAVFSRLNHMIQTSEYCHIAKPTLFTLNRRLVSDTSDVCFSVNYTVILREGIQTSGPDHSDVWSLLYLFSWVYDPGIRSGGFFRPSPTLVVYIYAIVDHSSLSLMDFYAFLCYDHLFKVRLSIASSIESCVPRWFQTLFKWRFQWISSL